MRPIPTGPVPKNWAARWKREHPEFVESKAKYVEVERVSAEFLINRVDSWFKELVAILDTFRLVADDIWNFDESPFFIGFLQGTLKVLSVRRKRQRAVRSDFLLRTRK
jgi:hypothetical protein